MDSDRRPTALLPALLARTLGFALLALLGAAEWRRMLDGAGLAGAVGWVAAGLLAGELVGAAAGFRGRVRVAAAALATAAGLLLAMLASGLEPRLLAPAHWSELSSGIGRGLEALGGVMLPYRGADPWPEVTVQLGGALLVTVAAALTAWPRRDGRGFPFVALAVLLALVVTPLAALGSSRSIALGLALAGLSVCFLWLERLPPRPGIGVAVLAGFALAGALPLSAAADREDPWFDYRAWAEGLGTPASVRFDWEHSYGPLTWKREGREMLRIRTLRPQYWKLENLEDFDGREWLRRTVPDPLGPEPEADLDRDWDTRARWTATARVTVRALRGQAFAGAGTTVSVDAGSRRASPTFSPGTWQADRELGAGDSYTVRFHAPRPSSVELGAASSGSRGEQRDALALVLPLLHAERPPSNDTRRPITAVRLELRPFAVERPPVAENERRGTSQPGIPALRNSPYWRTWRLAQRLKRGARTPYEFVRRVDAHFDRGFRYDERPPPPALGQPPLDYFLFEGRAGYCQHFSGAMALLLRFGGVPARVATGFSPGGFRRSEGEWVVRDRDAHSWVEAWFDGIGWVTFDPTPKGTPARSLIAAINAPGDTGATDSGANAVRAGGAREAGNAAGERGELDRPGPADAAGASRGDGGPSALLLTAGGGALLLAALALVLRRRARARPQLAPMDRAIADLVVALRRAGRPVAPGTTLSELERLGARREGSAYLTALRAARYGPADNGPTAEQRRAFRRDLTAGLGWRGRLRAWWALPPRRG